MGLAWLACVLRVRWLLQMQVTIFFLSHLREDYNFLQFIGLAEAGPVSFSSSIEAYLRVFH